MARKQPAIRRRELIEIALRQFLQQGYEQTSVRSIVGEADGNIGMFYHHFSSKEAIYEAALALYNADFVDRIQQLTESRRDLPLKELIGQILVQVEIALHEYAPVASATADRQILRELHQNSLEQLQPIFLALLVNYAERGEISLPDVDNALLSSFLLFGTSAVIHSGQACGMDKKVQTLQVLYDKLLN